MLKYIVVLASLANIFLFASGTLETCISAPIYIQPDICYDDNSISEFRKASIEYTANFLNAIIEDNPGETAIGVPIVSLNLLALLGLYSYGETLDQRLRALNLDNKEQVRCALKKINDALSQDKDNALNLDGVNIFGNTQYPFTEDFKQDTENYAGGKALNVNFGLQENAASYINNVVAEETNNEIRNIVSGDDFNKDTQLAAVSGITFTDTIKSLFSSDGTVTGPFYEASKTLDTDYLFQEQVYRYADSSKLKSQVVELPTKSIYTVYLIYPEADTDVSCVINKLGNYRTLDSVINSLKPTLVDLYFPDFDQFTTTIASRSIVKENLDVSLTYDPNKSQFQDIIVDNKDVTISFGTQKFFFVSAPNQQPSRSAPSDASDDYPTVELQLNRPFIFLITISVDSQTLPIICGYRATAN